MVLDNMAEIKSGDTHRLEEARRNIESLVRGKSEVVELALIALIAGGHLLLEDTPGVGKTLLALSLAKSIQSSFRRIQFTNDTLPADIIGTQVYSRSREKMEFIPGPLFAGVVLADEINRTSPKTQSALLEAMSERRVSVENEVYELPEPFMVIATQNPLEQQGTFPLPENQLDRFLFRTSIGYPGRSAELEILEREIDTGGTADIKPLISLDYLATLRAESAALTFDPALLEYIVDIVEATRRDERLLMGASTRGALMLKKAARAAALVRGRRYVIPEDIKDMAVPVLSHRIVARGDGALRSFERPQAETLVRSILDRIEVPL